MNHNGFPSSFAKERVPCVVRAVVVLDAGLPGRIRIHIEEMLLSRRKQCELLVAMQLRDPRMQAQDIVMEVWKLSAAPAKEDFEIIYVPK